MPNPQQPDQRRPSLPQQDQPRAPSRRRFLGVAALLAAPLAASTFGPRRVSAAAPASLQATQSVAAGDLRIGYAELGPRDGPAVLLLHGWPYDIQAFAEVAPALAADGYRVLVPFLRGYGATRFRSENALRNGQPAAMATDAIAFLDALRIDRVTLGGFDWGARTANIVAALWPERVKAMVSVSGYLIGSQAAGQKPLPPKAELSWWYQFYFATDRGRDGYAANTKAFARLIWELASPQWRFADATFDRTAAAFDNPDHVAIVIHNYRWRLALAAGEARFDGIEAKLAAAPGIEVPTITLEGDANGAPHRDPKAYAGKFRGKYQHRLINGGIGHNLPQEAPRDFAQAIRDVERL
jgi:pimeloyl-ACP methyl ester carboxylesterase